MNKRKLNKIFELIKMKAKLDYAVTNTDDCDKNFRYESKGIYVNLEDIDSIYISHDLTAEQADILIATFQENGYDIEPKEYNPTLAFKIREV